MSETMQSIRQQAFGGPEVLQLAEVERPVPLPTEMLVRVRAVGVNPVEAVIRSGQFPLLGKPPFILGWDISGVVEDIEPGVTRFQPGDEVYGMPFFPRAASAYAEYVAAPSRQLARKPAGLSHAEAAALPLAGLTAWQAARSRSRSDQRLDHQRRRDLRPGHAPALPHPRFLLLSQARPSADERR
jgi:NADPH:quinone reductase-like Zn-dependent oxidoreductase